MCYFLCLRRTKLSISKAEGHDCKMLSTKESLTAHFSFFFPGFFPFSVQKDDELKQERIISVEQNFVCG